MTTPWSHIVAVEHWIAVLVLQPSLVCSGGETGGIRGLVVLLAGGSGSGLLTGGGGGGLGGRGFGSGFVPPGGFIVGEGSFIVGKGMEIGGIVKRGRGIEMPRSD